MKPMFFAVILLAAQQDCEGPKAPEAPMKFDQETNQLEGARFQIRAVNDFADNSAYGGRRRIFILTDSQTGKEYVGVSGVGISELGTHGKGVQHEQ